jgi:hypothetical protein
MLFKMKNGNKLKLCIITGVFLGLIGLRANAIVVVGSNNMEGADVILLLQKSCEWCFRSCDGVSPGSLAMLPAEGTMYPIPLMRLMCGQALEMYTGSDDGEEEHLEFLYQEQSVITGEKMSVQVRVDKTRVPMISRITIERSPEALTVTKTMNLGSGSEQDVMRISLNSLTPVNLWGLCVLSEEAKAVKAMECELLGLIKSDKNQMKVRVENAKVDVETRVLLSGGDEIESAEGDFTLLTHVAGRQELNIPTTIAAESSGSIVTLYQERNLDGKKMSIRRMMSRERMSGIKDVNIVRGYDALSIVDTMWEGLGGEDAVIIFPDALKPPKLWRVSEICERLEEADSVVASYTLTAPESAHSESALPL